MDDFDKYGKLHGLKIIKDPPSTDPNIDWCPILPRGYKLPKSLFLVWIFTSTGPLIVLNSNLVWILIYKLEHPFFEQYKIEKDKQWPWKKDREAWMLKLRSAIANVLFNSLITNALTLGVYFWASGWHFKFMDMRTETVPTPLEFAKQLVVLVICDDFCFYWCHRLLHVRHEWMPLYQLIHKKHHEFS